MLRRIPNRHEYQGIFKYIEAFSKPFVCRFVVEAVPIGMHFDSTLDAPVQQLVHQLLLKESQVATLVKSPL